MNERRAPCDGFVAEFVIERYVAGTLSEPEAEAFEEHLLTCRRCRDELRLAVAVREALGSEGKEAEPALRRLPWKGIGIGVTLAAAAVAALLLLPADGGSGPIAELGRVTQPPVYLGVPVRQAPARPDSAFEAAMQAYVAGDYGAAAAGLEAAAAGADPAASRFFLGASLLMLDRPARAAAAFRAVLEARDSPYRAEARFYLAKALLRLGDAGAALAQLEALSAAAGPVEAELSEQARALADSVEALVRP